MGIDSTKGSTIRILGDTTQSLSNTFQKASSGKRINKASDDSAGLAIAMALQTDSVEISQGSRNAYDAQSAINIASGAMQQISDISTRQAELAQEAANGTYSDAQRQIINQEAQSLAQESQRIQQTTTFNGMNVLQGSFSVQVGTNSSENSKIEVSSNSPSSSAIDLSTAANARAALDSVNSYIASNSQAQGQLGATYARLDTAIQNNNVARENILAAASRIEDADMGETAANITKYSTQQKIGTQVLQQQMQSGTSTLNLIKKA